MHGSEVEDEDEVEVVEEPKDENEVERLDDEWNELVKSDCCSKIARE